MWHPVEAAKDALEDFGLKVAALALLVGTALIGLVWLTIALFEYLQYSMGPAGGAALTGVLALLPFAITALWISLHRDPKAKEKEKKHDHIPETMLLALAPRLASTVSRVAKRHPLEAVLLCAAIGFMLARQPSSIIAILTALLSGLDQVADGMTGSEHETPPSEAAGSNSGAQKEKPDAR